MMEVSGFILQLGARNNCGGKLHINVNLFLYLRITNIQLLEKEAMRLFERNIG